MSSKFLKKALDADSDQINGYNEQTYISEIIPTPMDPTSYITMISSSANPAYNLIKTDITLFFRMSRKVMITSNYLMVTLPFNFLIPLLLESTIDCRLENINKPLIKLNSGSCSI